MTSQEQELQTQLIAEYDQYGGCFTVEEISSQLFPEDGAATAVALGELITEMVEQGMLVRLCKEDGEFVLPRFQFDRSGNVRSVVAYTNHKLGAKRSPHAIAEWWITKEHLSQDIPVRALLADRFTLTLVRNIADWISRAM